MTLVVGQIGLNKGKLRLNNYESKGSDHLTLNIKVHAPTVGVYTSNTGSAPHLESSPWIEYTNKGNPIPVPDKVHAGIKALNNYWKEK